MIELLQASSLTYGALFPIVNPIGSSIIFLALVADASQDELNHLAFKIATYSTIMLIFVLFLGASLLKIFGISIPIVLIAGGLLLFFVGWQLLNKPNTTSGDKIHSNNLSINEEQQTFYPLTMPVTVGPCCIAIVIALGARGSNIKGDILFINQIGHMVGILLIGLTIYVCYRYANTITRKLGTSGTQIVMSLAGFINICIGLSTTWQGMSYLIYGKLQPFLGSAL